MGRRQTRVTLIAAADLNDAIGRQGKIPWRLSADMEHFRNTTMGGIVLMGRKTYQSIPDKYFPLEGRENWILSTTLRTPPKGTRLFESKGQVLVYARGKEIFVIGGAEIYKAFLPDADRIILTRVATRVANADTRFPPLPRGWGERLVLEHRHDERNHYPFRIIEYTRPGFVPELS